MFPVSVMWFSLSKKSLLLYLWKPSTGLLCPRKVYCYICGNHQLVYFVQEKFTAISVETVNWFTLSKESCTAISVETINWFTLSKERCTAISVETVNWFALSNESCTAISVETVNWFTLSKESCTAISV